MRCDELHMPAPPRNFICGFRVGIQSAARPLLVERLPVSKVHVMLEPLFGVRELWGRQRGSLIETKGARRKAHMPLLSRGTGKGEIDLQLGRCCHASRTPNTQGHSWVAFSSTPQFRRSVGWAVIWGMAALLKGVSGK